MVRAISYRAGVLGALLWEALSLAKTRAIEPVIRFVAVISRDPQVAGWARAKIAAAWGEIAESTAPLPFTANDYYRDEMGSGLTKTLLALAAPADPAGLADWKTETNAWEWLAASEFAGATARPLNLDPGYITQAKLVLATVKDRDHRVYLRDGIFGEITLSYVGGRWIDHRWTYPDYRGETVFDFATRCRIRLRQHLRNTDGFRTAKKNSFLHDAPPPSPPST